MKKKREYVRLRADSGQHRRILIVTAILGCVAFIPVALRLYDLMVVNYEYYSRMALRNQTRTTSVTAERGTIYDRNMNVLACSVGVENVFLDPHELKQSGADVSAISQVLGDILDLDPAWIAKQAADRTMRYKQIGAKVGAETSAQIRNYINSNGIYRKENVHE